MEEPFAEILRKPFCRECISKMFIAFCRDTWAIFYDSNVEEHFVVIIFWLYKMKPSKGSTAYVQHDNQDETMTHTERFCWTIQMPRVQ